MMLKIKKRQSNWHPVLWESAYHEFPMTSLNPYLAKAASLEFLHIWNSWQPTPHDELEIIKERLHIILVRGIFGSTLPGNFTEVEAFFQRNGFEVTRSPVYLTGKISASAKLVRKAVLNKVNSQDRFIFLAQSKGGLDTLWMLMNTPKVLDQTLGVILVQTPSGPSAIMESVFLHAHNQSASFSTRAKEKLMKTVLSLPFLKPGCMDLTRGNLPKHVDEIQSFSFPFPIISLATWSTNPSSWLDSYHERLCQIRPNAAHDGQFFLEDQLWPCFEQVLIGQIDHAQSVMARQGLHTVRLWDSLLKMLSHRMTSI